MADSLNTNPGESLKTVQAILDNWHEAPLPGELPESVTHFAIPGSKLHAGFIGKDVWFWDTQGLRCLLDFTENYDRACGASPSEYRYAVYFLRDGLIDLAGGAQDSTIGDAATIRELWLDKDASLQAVVFWIDFFFDADFDQGEEGENADNAPPPRHRGPLAISLWVLLILSLLAFLLRWLRVI